MQNFGQVGVLEGKLRNGFCDKIAKPRHPS
jgi:hypothetical protein